MKGRESGMPDESDWETFFNPACRLVRLDCAGACGDVVEFGCGYGTFTLPAAGLVSGRVIALDIEPRMVAITEGLSVLERSTSLTATAGHGYGL